MKKLTSILVLVLVLIMVFSVPVSAYKSYQTYTYSIDGFALHSPDAYVPTLVVDSQYMGLDTAIDDPRDIFVDDQKNVYIVDAANNRVVVLDRYYKLKFTISNFTNEYGVVDGFNNPSGLFVTPDRIFICDTNNNRIVTFDRAGNYLEIIEAPESQLFDEGAIYRPVAIAVDQFDRLYVVSSTTFQGVIVMTDKGEFTGFIGAQKVTISAWQIIWRRFQTDKQRELSAAYVPTEFNNLTINKDGFIYVTTSSLDQAQVESAINKKDTSGDYAPVKMLNNSGAEIMRRNGFWPPSGEIAFGSVFTNSISGPSTVTDVAIGPEDTWSLIDEKRNKIFTSDFDGNLLFAFGDTGQQIGNLSGIEGIAYQGDFLLVLDKTNDNITVYKRTEYGDTLIEALSYNNNREYDKAIDSWREILKRNSNFDTAYVGIGQSMYRSGDYEGAMEYFKAAYDVTNYSQAYKEIRKEWVSKYILLIPLTIIAICAGVIYFMRYAGKVNAKTAITTGKRTFKQELLYVFHVIFHPFDGFWDLKHEKRGSVRAAVVFIVITVLSFYYQAIGQGYVVNPYGNYSSILMQAISVLVPLLLFAIANWCLTPHFDGEGSFKDIFVAMGYSMLPLPLTVIPTTIFSNIVTADEANILTLIVSFGFIWMGLLVFCGMMVTHDYSMFKNITTTLGTAVGMAVIMFVGILFSTLLGKLISFVSNIIIEINYRL